MAKNNKNLSSDELDLSSDTNSIDSYDLMMNPLPIAHRAIGLLNSFGVPSFIPWDIDTITREMQAFYPSKKTNHRAIAVNYFNQVKIYLTKGILLAKQGQIDEELIPISFRELRNEIGRYGSKNKQHYWFDWFQTNHPLIVKVKEGYKFGKQGTLTMVKTTMDINLILASQDPKYVFDSYYGKLDPESSVDLCAIDLQSLSNYLQANKAIYKRTKTLDENLKLASTIMLIASAPQCKGYLPQVISESQFGRKYYKGINLQTAPKIVRQAALGECHQYDIEASVFTWKLDFVKSQYQVKLPATIDYLEFKNHHRTRLAELVFSTKEPGYVSYIKQAITAIGFGARKTNAVWTTEQGTWKRTALREIIKSQVLLDKFLNDAWVKEFIQEQETMNALIWNEIKDCDLIVNDPNLRNKNNQISKNRAIAKIYQTTERKMLSALTEIAQDSEVLLMCHDGFYTKHKAKLAELKECLKDYMPSGNLDYEYHSKYIFVDPTFVNEHKQFIEQQEAQAREHTPQGYRRGKDEATKLKQKYKAPQEDFDNGYRDDLSSMRDYDPEQDEYWDQLSQEEQRDIMELKESL